jgi:hypothetical protein
MKFQLKQLLWPLILVFLIPLKSTAAVLIQSIPYLLEITKQALLSLALIAGYLVNVKPEFPSQADSEIQSQVIETNFLNQFLQDVSKQTGVTITPNLFKQLEHAGMHHDYKKLETLLSELRPTRDTLTHPPAKIVPPQSESNHYALVQGIKRFEQQGVYSNATISSTAYRYSPTATYTFKTENNNTAPLIEKKTIHSVQTNNAHEYSNEFPTQSNSQSINSTLTLQSTTHTKNSNSTQYMRQLHHQHALYAQGKAIHEWETAYTCLAPHFFDSDLRKQLFSYVRKYQKVLANACQYGASLKTMEAQTQIALQGLPLPGFLNEFSEVLQEKISQICFKNVGPWKGAESPAQMEELKKACQAYNNLLDTLLDHLTHENQAQSQDCIEELYIMDQGRGSWASRFFSWMGSFFDENSISFQELQTRIAHNPFNQQIFAASELLEKNELKLARIPLEEMAGSAKTSNGVLLYQNLLGQYQQKVALAYGTTNIPLKYQNDPVFWLYKPSAEHMKFDDPALRFIESHLAIRDAFCNEILKNICKKQTPTPFIQNLAYHLIDKLHDPIAVINYLEFLSTDNQNPEIQQACNAFYDKGVLNLFGLTKQASAYRVPASDLLNRSEYAHMRTAFNTLLLVDTKTQQSKQSQQLAFSCIPLACSNNEFSREYQSIVQAITQAHMDSKASKGILQITSIPLDASCDLQRTILKAMGKAAYEDITRTAPSASSPLSTAEAWTYINKVQELESHGQKAEASALANTYLIGYLDEKMPTKEYIKPLVITVAMATATTGGIWWANSQDNRQRPAHAFEQSPFFKSPDHDDEEDDEVEDIKKHSFEEIFNSSTRGDKTKGKSKNSGKNGEYPEGNKDPENNDERKQYQHITNKESDKTAKELGFEKTNLFTKKGNRPIYKKGNKYISPDLKRHNGGFWKMANSVENLNHRETRMGTYNQFLNFRIGD